LEKELAADKAGNSKNFIKYIKQRNRSRDPVGPLIKESGETVTEEIDIARELNRFFASVFTEENKAEVPSKQPQTALKLDKITIQKEAIVKKIKNLRPDLAAGPDGIHPRLLVECAETLSEPLSIIFKKSMRESIVPKDWKKAIVTPIFKKAYHVRY
jgi:hypothetical protein